MSLVLYSWWCFCYLSNSSTLNTDFSKVGFFVGIQQFVLNVSLPFDYIRTFKSSSLELVWHLEVLVMALQCLTNF